jgi:hypothetical protein
MWGLLWPFEPLQMKPGSWEVTNFRGQIPRGEDLRVHVGYCLDDFPATLETAIEQDGRILLMDAKTEPLRPGCHDENEVLITVPQIMPIESTYPTRSGVARVRVTYKVQVHPLREIAYKFETSEFVILE